MNKRTQTENLWKSCFGDSDEYIRLYFDAKYNDNNTYEIIKNSQMVSVLQAIPYDICFQNVKLSGGYIAGACTNPDFRKQGFMRQLLSTTIQSQFHRYKDVLFLIPAESWLFDYYAQCGFSSQFFQSTENKHIDTYLNTNVQVLNLKEAQSPEIFNFYRNTTATRNGVVHTAEDFAAVVAEHYLSGGRMLLIGSVDTPRAMALALPVDSGVHVPELLASTEDDKMALINDSAQLFSQHNVTILTTKQKDPYAMIRIINVLHVLQIFASINSEIQQIIYIEDPIITENSGTYQLINGKCLRISHSTPGATWNIEELANFVFRKSLFINLMFE